MQRRSISAICSELTGGRLKWSRRYALRLALIRERCSFKSRNAPRLGLKLRVTASLTLIVGGVTCGSAEAIARLREQDDEFCRRLRIAIEMGSELPHHCPILNYTRPD
jgi:hypothetical protein